MRAWLLIVTASLGVLCAAAITGFFVWLKFYAQSEGFRSWIEKAATHQLGAQASVAPIQWDHSAGRVASFSVTGNRETPFASIAAENVRVVLDTGGLWSRTWKIDGIQAGRLLLDFSNDLPRTAEPPPKEDEHKDHEGDRFDLLGKLWPDRTRVASVLVDRMDVIWKTPGYSLEARGTSLQFRPSADLKSFPATGRGGVLTSSAFPRMPVEVGYFDAALAESGTVRINQFQALSYGAWMTAAGSIGGGENPHLALSGTVTGLDLARCAPGEWMNRLTGKAGGTVEITGDPRELHRLLWQGTFRLHADSVLEGVPVLEVIARKTGNDAFLRLALKEASTDFTRSPDGGWRLERMSVNIPGLLRIRGGVELHENHEIQGELLAGVVPGTLRSLEAAEQTVFLPLAQLSLTPAEQALVLPDDAGLVWTRVRLGGTLEEPREDLAERLSKAWFNRTLEEVLRPKRTASVTPGAFR